MAETRERLRCGNEELANSTDNVARRLQRMADGYKETISPLIKTDTITNAILATFARMEQQLGRPLLKQEQIELLNRYYNAAQPLTQL